MAILVEELLMTAFTAAGVKISTRESVEPKDDYVLMARLGGEDDAVGVGSGRESVDIGLNVYAKGQVAAIKLSYLAREICKSLEAYSAVSSVEATGFSELPDDNSKQGYTFSIAVMVNQSNTQGG